MNRLTLNEREAIRNFIRQSSEMRAMLRLILSRPGRHNPMIGNVSRSHCSMLLTEKTLGEAMTEE